MDMVEGWAVSNPFLFISSWPYRAKLSSLRSHLPPQEERSRLLPTLQKRKKGHSLPPFPLKAVCQLFVSVNPRFREPCWRVRFQPPGALLFFEWGAKEG
jgi:hypothetical protein